jgi:hypothetical protein
LRTTKGTASQTLRCLETKGLVRRVSLPQDRRSVRIDLTPAGEAVLSSDPLRCLERSAETLGEEREALGRALAKMAEGLDRSAGFKGFGLCNECTQFCKNTAPPDGAPFRCGLTGEDLSASDAGKICVNQVNGGTYAVASAVRR